MQCAQCHHHPFERWSQDDYYSLAAFFSQVGRKPSGTRGEDLIFHKRGMATATNIKTGVPLKPAALGRRDSARSPPMKTRGCKLADWMSTPKNPFFAKALVNRYWKHFFQRGLIEPEDDIRDTNPPTNPELLAALEKHFIDSGFDLKELVRVITRSQAYQLSSMPNEHNLADRQNYSRYYPRRLQAEVLLDAIDQLAGTQTDFANLPPGTRAVGAARQQLQHRLRVPAGLRPAGGWSVCECERVQSSSLAQSLHLINSGRAARQDRERQRPRRPSWPPRRRRRRSAVREAYLVAFSREPTASELQTAMSYLSDPVLDEQGQPIANQPIAQTLWQDIVWALLNTKEFLFNH